MPRYIARKSTHEAQVMFTARCRTCNWSSEFIHQEDAKEAVHDHHDEHRIEHDHRYDEHAGWLTEDCPGCQYEAGTG